MTNIRTSIQPWLSVGNSAKAGMFYSDAFGAIETYRMETPDGGLVLKLSVDGAEFWVSGQTSDTEEVNANRLRQEEIKKVWTVKNPHGVYEKAIKRGAKEVFPVGEDFGWRLGRLSDPFGIDWEIGKPLTMK